jgi:NAD(P)-dependent dehydrogenase (short-subunit alcohol dehydrogenase family)
MTTRDTSMQDRVCLLTGATRGVGLATARGLAARGATLTIVGRDPQKTAATAADLRKITGNDTVEYLVADLSSQAEVRKLADAFKARHDRLHVLINNAGAVFTKRQVTVDGIEQTLALNHLSVFLLTNLLLDTIKASAPARIITVASAAHQGARLNFDDLQHAKSYNAFSVYSQSKLDNVLFTYELARRLAGTGVTANCLHPGFVASGFGKNNAGWMSAAMVVVRPFQITPERGALTTLYLATSPDVATTTGTYFSQSKPRKSDSVTYDEALAKRLWDVSEQLTGLRSTAAV